MKLCLRSIFVLPMLLVPELAHATDASVFVSCELDNGAQMEVLIRHGSFSGEGGFSYSYRPETGPELNLSVSMAEGPVTPWAGVGRAIWSSVSFADKGQIYEVWNSFDRLEPSTGLQAGLNISGNGEYLDDFSCVSGDIAPVFTLEDEMMAAGYCWDRNDFAWRRTDCG